jgi:hypothetical protein
VLQKKDKSTSQMKYSRMPNVVEQDPTEHTEQHRVGGKSKEE